MSRQKVENKNTERAEVNKVVTIKCSFWQNSGPEGWVLYSRESKTLTAGGLTMNTAHPFRTKSATLDEIIMGFSRLSSVARFNPQSVQESSILQQTVCSTLNSPVIIDGLC